MKFFLCLLTFSVSLNLPAQTLKKMEQIPIRDHNVVKFVGISDGSRVCVSAVIKTSTIRSYVKTVMRCYFGKNPSFSFEVTPSNDGEIGVIRDAVNDKNCYFRWDSTIAIYEAVGGSKDVALDMDCL